MGFAGALRGKRWGENEGNYVSEQDKVKQLTSGGGGLNGRVNTE